MTLPPLSPDQQVKPRRFELRMSLMYSTLFLAPGIHLPYFPLWLEHAGFQASQIAVILSVPMFLRMATTPYITAYADRAGERVTVLLLLLVASLALSFGYYLTPTYGGVLAVSIMLAIVWTPHALIVDSIALSGVRRYGSDYSRMRVWGSSSFLAANVVGGMVLAATGPETVPMMITAGMVAMLVMATMLPRLGRPRVASPLSATGLQQVAPSLFTRPFLLFVAGAGIINASHGFLYGFVSIYWKSTGLSEATVGALWAWSVTAEVLMFFAFTRIFGKTSAPRLIVYAGLAAMVRWGLVPLMLPAGFGVPGYFAVQTLHAFSTGLILIGVQKMIADAVAEHRTGAAQGIAFFANGLSMAAVTLASGPLYATYGVNGFFVMVAVAAVGVALVIAGARSQPQSAGEGGETSDPV
jgi:PPP family 3-phenylpropionic acid transporter